MKTVLAIVAILAAVLLCRPAQAQSLIYTNESDFDAALASSPAFTNDFTNYDAAWWVHPLPWDNGTVGCQITTTPDLYLSVFDGGITTWDTNASIDITINSGNITAIGGLFYSADINQDQTNGTISLFLSDGTSTNCESSTNGLAQFIGFISTGPVITSLIVSNAAGGQYPALTHLIMVADPPPIIQLSAPKTITISWPATPTQYSLVTAPSLSSTNWTNTGATAQQIGSRMQATVPLSANAAFFRLSH